MHATDLGDKYPYLFQVAAYHTQHPDDRNLLCQYPIHKDKAGKITAFYCVEGWSFNFIAVQCKNGKQKKVTLLRMMPMNNIKCSNNNTSMMSVIGRKY